MPRLFVVFLVGLALNGTLAGCAREQRLPIGVVREFAQGHPVSLAWWQQPGNSPGGRVEQRILVLDATAGTVSAYTPEGVLVQSFGELGTGPGQLMNPQGLAADESGRIYVADTGNDRVEIFDGQGKFLRALGHRGIADGEFKNPYAVAIADMQVGRDSLVVADAGNDRLSIFDSKGTFRKNVPVHKPRGLAEVSGNGVVVVSAGQRSLQNVYDARGPFLYDPLSHTWPARHMKAPVALAKWDETYVADAGARQVLIFERDGRLRRILSAFDPPPVAVLPGQRSEADSVYVADGRRVREISVVVDSPLPVFERYRACLAKGDIDGALTYVHPSTREEYRQILEGIRKDLPIEAERMKNVSVSSLWEDRAELLIRDDEKHEDFPVKMVRGFDGSWQIEAY